MTTILPDFSKKIVNLNTITTQASTSSSQTSVTQPIALTRPLALIWTTKLPLAQTTLKTLVTSTALVTTTPATYLNSTTLPSTTVLTTEDLNSGDQLQEVNFTFNLCNVCSISNLLCENITF